MKWSIRSKGSRRTVTALSKDLDVVNPGDAIEWTVIDTPKSSIREEYENVGLIDFDFNDFDEENIRRDNPHYNRPFGKLFQKLWPGNVVEQIQNMNDFIRKENKKNKAAKDSQSRTQYREAKEVTMHEFWRFVGIIIAASSCKQGGKNLWDVGGDVSCHTMCAPINYGPTGMNLMPLYRFVLLRKAFGHAFHDKKSDSDWAQIVLLIDGYNSNRKKNIAASFRKVFDESMSAMVPRTTPTGGLPTISYIMRKPEPLGTEFKVSFE